MERDLQAVVLAAGKSTRFKTNHSKLVEKICGQEMILYITKLLESFKIPATLVVGYKKEFIQDLVSKHHPENFNFVHQVEQLGTGHALMCTREFWNNEHVLVLNGDVPLINSQIIESLYQKHISQSAEITFAVAHNTDSSLNSYGRVVHEGGKVKIVEAKDDTRENPEHCCVNAGIYLFKKDFLEKNIDEITKSKVTGELYITDLIALASKKGFKVETVSCQVDAIRGINTIQELYAAEQIKRSEIISKFMQNGVRFACVNTTQIDLNVVIGAGSYIGSGTQIYGDTTIGSNCKIEAFCVLEKVILEDNVIIKPHSVVRNSVIKSKSLVGPFAHIHSNSVINSNVVIGNFIEIKNSHIDENTKAKHLSYLGDSSIGKNVNIGAGTITCNFNGISKEKTIIKDNVFIGSNNSLIAPITIGNNAYTAAGSTLNQDVPDFALAIARSMQINKEGYAKDLLQSRKEERETYVVAKKMDNEKPSENV